MGNVCLLVPSPPFFNIHSFKCISYLSFIRLIFFQKHFPQSIPSVRASSKLHLHVKYIRPFLKQKIKALKIKISSIILAD